MFGLYFFFSSSRRDQIKASNRALADLAMPTIEQVDYGFLLLAVAISILDAR